MEKKKTSPVAIAIALVVALFFLYSILDDSYLLTLFVLPLSVSLFLGSAWVRLSEEQMGIIKLVIGAMVITSLYHDYHFMMIAKDEIASVVNSMSSQTYGMSYGSAQQYASNYINNHSYLNNKLYIPEMMYDDGFSNVVYYIQALLIVVYGWFFIKICRRSESNNIKYIYVLNIGAATLALVSILWKLFALYLYEKMGNSWNAGDDYAWMVTASHYALIAAAALSFLRVYKFYEAGNTNVLRYIKHEDNL